ncbi:MAG: hypothetical protein HY611_02775 [Elusimicrobia bacterium]|nr:hypothetical protein [Elusimicrobiota bacterium]
MKKTVIAALILGAAFSVGAWAAKEGEDKAGEKPAAAETKEVKAEEEANFCAKLMAGGGEKKAGKKDAKRDAAELEKQKALQSPYPNDCGPETLDVSKYPKELQAGYKILSQKCSRCHTPARPLHSEFVELASGAKDKKAQDKDKEQQMANLKKTEPELFKNPRVWKVEADIWKRYVKRMQAKPGCEIETKEAKSIWEFLVYDSNLRKMGAAKKDWEKFRKKLLADFKQFSPKRYHELYEESEEESEAGESKK